MHPKRNQIIVKYAKRPESHGQSLTIIDKEKMERKIPKGV
jgi:hypothetical protein